ncbi:MAG: hypothetical protein DRJ08_00545 [Acidobacteria bacterium]|nr:MAG: hypothetical protein DRJ08_00545 [Acidobacteriota bacterium]
MGKRKINRATENSRIQRYATVFLTVLWGILFFLLLFLPADSSWLRWTAVCAILLSFPLAATLNRQKSVRNLAPLDRALDSLNDGDLEPITTAFLSNPEPHISSLHGKLIQLVLNIQGLLGHLDLISGNIAGISHSVNEQLVTYIRDVKNQLVNTDVTLQSAGEIHDFMESISADISRLSEIAQETLSFLKEIVESNENVSLKMESLSAYARDTEDAMGEIIAHTEKVTQNTENLASMVMETSASIMEMDATISEIRKQARQTEIQAEEAGEVAKEGLNRTREASKTVESAGVAFETVSKTIRQLKAESMKIGEIVTGIRRISDQTSILALNATIAASQSEHPDRSFQVIAEKIRELAITSSISMKEAGDVLTGMEKLVDDGHEIIEEAGDVVRSGVVQVRGAESSLENIVQHMQSVVDNIAIVSQATEEHVEGSAQINKATQRVSIMTEEIAELMKRQSETVLSVNTKTDYIGLLVESMKELTTEQNGKVGKLLDYMKEIGQDTRKALRQSKELSMHNQKILNAIRNIREVSNHTYRNTAILSDSALSLEKFGWHLENRLNTFHLPSPKSGGTLRISGFSLPHDKLDPLAGSTVYEAQVLSLLHRGLVRYDPLFNLEPDLAHSWDVSGDGRKYTFRLRENAVFHNGQPITARDVISTFMRLLSPDFECGAAGMYFVIEGTRAFAEGKAKDISGIQALDEHTVQFMLEKPLAFFTGLLTMTYAAIVPETDYLRGPQETFSGMGCGPFALVLFEPGKTLTVRKFDEFYMPGRPFVDKVYLDLSTRDNMFDAFESGNIDILSINEPDDLDEAATRNSLVKDILTSTQLSTYFLAINCKKPPFSDPHIRQALSLAINREKLCLTFPLKLAEPAASIIPPGLLGHSPAAMLAIHDPEKSRWLLEQHGFDFNQEIELTFARKGNEDPGDITAIAEDLTKVGIRVRLNGMKNHWPYIEKRAHTMFRVGWIADYPDPDNFIHTLFNPEAGDPLFLGAELKEVGPLSEKARFTMNPRQRTETYQKIEQIISEQAPLIPLYHKKEILIRNPGVSGIILRGFSPFLDVENVWFNQMT